MTSKNTLLRLSVAAVWLLTAAASLAYPHEQSIALLERVGLRGNIADMALYAGIAMDVLMGVLSLLNFRSLQKWLWPLQGGVIIVYSLIIAVCLPDYALHPFGVLIKNLPILAILWLLWCDAKQGEAHV